METDDKRAEQVIGFLKKSKPEISHQDILTEKIMGRLRDETKKGKLPSRLGDCLFGWVYIGWVRRSLTLISVAILAVFIWQQSVIIRRINYIDRQVRMTVSSGAEPVSGLRDGRDLIRRIEYVLPANKRNLNEREIDELIESLNGLQVKYKDVLKRVQEDPELKKYLDKKLNERNSK